jgi:tetratricopeptide (TPR) repeat protein
LKKLLDVDPEDATACNDLGYLWADQGKNLEEAEKLIRKAIDRDRAERARQRGESQGRPVAELPPAEKDNAAYIDSLGWVLYKRGQVQEAQKELEYASGLADGDDPVIWDHLGEVYEHLGRPEKAVAAWQKALQLYETARRVGHDDRREELRTKLQALKDQAKARKK